MHPDKVAPSARETATIAFQELSNAYHLLSDRQKRSDYDVSRFFASQFPAPSNPVTKTFFAFIDLNLDTFMSESAFDGFSDTATGFYSVYYRIFEKVYNQEVLFVQKSVYKRSVPSVRPAPPIGDADSPYALTSRFYTYWLEFATVIDFEWLLDLKKRIRARKEYNAAVIGLAKFVRSKDRRVVKHCTMPKELDEKQRVAAAEKAAVVAAAAAEAAAAKAQAAVSLAEAYAATASAKAAAAAAAKIAATACSVTPAEAVVSAEKAAECAAAATIRMRERMAKKKQRRWDKVGEEEEVERKNGEDVENARKMSNDEVRLDRDAKKASVNFSFGCFNGRNSET